VTGLASEAIAYPVLDDSQQARLRRYGTTRRVTAGEILYSPGDDSCDLLVVLSGEVVVSNDALGRSVELARHGPGQFAGELNMLTGQRPFPHRTSRNRGLGPGPDAGSGPRGPGPRDRCRRHPAAGPDCPAAPARLRCRPWCRHRDHRHQSFRARAGAAHVPEPQHDRLPVGRRRSDGPSRRHPRQRRCGQWRLAGGDHTHPRADERGPGRSGGGAGP